MSELQAYYDSFRTGYWAAEHPDDCPCHGGGWALSDVDTWHECPIHFCGQPHPHSWDSGEVTEEEIAEALLVWAVKHGRAEFTREEAARREAADALNNVPPKPFESDDIPF